MSYAELDARSNFTFLTGAAHPEELVETAGRLGLAAIAITDENSFAGIVRAHAAARTACVRYIVGTRLALEDGQTLLAYPQDRAAYGRLCRLLTIGKRRAAKGGCRLGLDDVLAWGEGSALIGLEIGEAGLARLLEAFGEAVGLGLSPLYDGVDPARFAARGRLAARVGARLVATGNVLFHRAARRRLADVLSCIREKTTIDALGVRALPNAERRLKSPFEMRRLFRDYPDATAASCDIAERCRFSLSELKYEYPEEVAEGEEPMQRLRDLTEAGLAGRYPDGVPLAVRALVEREFSIISELDYAPYFLTVHDVVKFARERNILCQGRGSAANSVVCYALGVTSVSPEIITMVFERFVSEARGEPPDIDVDFEHERREEVIQHIYTKYGRHRAGLCATVIHFRSRAAIREVGKAMGLSADAVGVLTAQVWGWSDGAPAGERLLAAGLDPADPRLRLTLELISELIGFPRHLSQHVGGFVITRGRLDELAPVENAAMADRTVIEWDKDDIDVLGILKVDVLALGMLTCLRKALDLVAEWKGVRYDLASIPAEDPEVYAQLSRGDTVGLFQVESRAQMAFLPRMRPKCFYDLVIEVAIIRPGPIQGDMVHPYLRRRRGEEAVSYPSKELEAVLKRTLGVPLFQEQAMQIAMVAAGFSPGEADALRRALGAFRKVGSVSDFRERFMQGAQARGYTQDFAERCFRQLEGFSGYGFPESHAASFALLVYASAWLRRRHPEVYACAILNSQPMGFYAPAQLVADARRHGVEVRPVDVNASGWDCALEPDGCGGLALRLGLRLVKGFRQEDATWLAAARGNGYGDVAAVRRRAGLGAGALEKLAMADAFASLGLNRREALWRARAVDCGPAAPLLERAPEDLPDNPLPAAAALSLAEDVFEDFVSTRLSLKAHPVALVRPRVAAAGRAGAGGGAGALVLSDALRDIPQGGRARVLGAVITRQRPATASGVVFITLEDEAGAANLVVWPSVLERFRREVMQARLMRVAGRVQKEGLVVHLVAETIEDLSDFFDALGDGRSVDDAAAIDMTWSSQDEAKRPVGDARLRPSRPAAATSVPGERPAAPGAPPAVDPHSGRVLSGGAPDPARRRFASRDFR